jgi:hypothetical protein
MRLKWLLAPLLCGLLAVGSLAAPSSTGLGTVGGHVLDVKGKPVAQAHVTLQASEGDQFQTTETNTQGHFWFPLLPEGQYSVGPPSRDAFPSGAKVSGSHRGARPTSRCTFGASTNRASDSSYL